jgi:hypothetical protein
MWPTGNANDLRATAVDVEPTDRRTIKGKTALGLPLDPVSRRYPRRTWQSEAEWLALGNAQLTSLLKLPEDPMSRTFALVLTVLGSLWLPGQAFAQFAPSAGSAGAGPSAISGVPYGPANPRSASDPSGIGNASSLPPLRSNTPVPVVASTPTAPIRSVTPPSYSGGSRPSVGAYAVESRSKAPPHRRGRPQVSSFTGICRGC